MAIRLYNDALFGDDMYDKFGDYRFDEAETRKQQLRQQLGEEMFNYVEEYRGLKYEDFPFEYQQLVKARIAMRPYWRAEQELIAIRGEPKTPYQQKRFDYLLSRIRKRMRSTNPEIAYYYDLFYKRQ